MRVKAEWTQPSGFSDMDPRVSDVEILQFIFNQNLKPGYTLRNKAEIVAIVVLSDGRLDYAELQHLRVKPQIPDMMEWDLAQEVSVTGTAACRINENGEVERVELRD